MDDLILNPDIAPSFDEITTYIHPPAREIWLDLTGFIQETFRAVPKITYSVCSGKPGWNVKYQKSGKSLCTLYPEKNCFIALVVIKTEHAALLPGAQPSTHPLILDQIARSKPFNNTYWLMLPVTEHALLDNVKDLLVQKRKF